MKSRNTRVAICHTVFIAGWIAIASTRLDAQAYFEVVRSLNQSGFLSTLMEAADGSIYVTLPGAGPAGLGTISRMTSSGTAVVLHEFTGPNGAEPWAALVQSTDGNFYGTTLLGGSSACFEGCGTVFRMAPDGHVTVLHAFTGDDGSAPSASLIQASDGNFYGTTRSGGKPLDRGSLGGSGTVFRITADGSYTVLHAFTESEGAFPSAALIQAADGAFYGTTLARGQGSSNAGSIFRITSDGTFAVLHYFTGGLDGVQPNGALLLASDGNFYGTTSGLTFGAGTVFRMTPGGAVMTLHAFTGIGEGAYLYGSLIEKDGAFYGTTLAGGPANAGTIFRLSSDGTLSTIYAFRGVADGWLPQGSFILARDGALYGVTQGGGAFNLGTVFRMSPTPPPNRSFAADFDGDGRSDLVVYRPDNGTWFIRYSTSWYRYSNATTYQWGLPGDIPLAADFDGDGRTDLVVYRPTDGRWYFRFSTSGYSYANAISYQWGEPGDIPLVADFDGDRKADLVVYRPSNGGWYISLSSTGYGRWIWYQWGVPGDVPLVADFDGDGKTDLAVYRPSNGGWYISLSRAGYGQWVWYRWGTSHDAPLPMDVDRDGRADLVFWRPSTGEWSVLYSSTLYAAGSVVQWGLDGDYPIRSDFDGDRRGDFVVWRPRTGEWYLRYSSANFSYTSATSYQWGQAGDDPI